MIEELFKVTVEVPEKIWDEFGHQRIYENKLSELSRTAIESGVEKYSNVTEWATFDSYHEAEQFELKLLKFIKELEGQAVR